MIKQAFLWAILIVMDRTVLLTKILVENSHVFVSNSADTISEKVDNISWKKLREKKSCFSKSRKEFCCFYWLFGLTGSVCYSRHTKTITLSNFDFWSPLGEFRDSEKADSKRVYSKYSPSRMLFCGF